MAYCSRPDRRSDDRGAEDYKLTPGIIKGAAMRTLAEGFENGTTVDQAEYTEGDEMRTLVKAVALKVLDPKAAAEPEAVELDPRLTTFKADFDADPKLKAKCCSWELIRDRLLANEGHYLALAQSMEQGGVLFGIDAEGNPLISDRGDEPIMKGMNYKDTRDRVLYKHDRLDKAGKMELDEDKKPVATGYEMFTFSGDYVKGEEIKMFESHTGKPFVKSSNGNEWRSSWLESGENPSWPRAVNFGPYYSYAGVAGEFSRLEDPGRGVRRLLRVKKA